MTTHRNGTDDPELRKFNIPRPPRPWMVAVRGAVACTVRVGMGLYNRLEIRGRENLPLGRSFVLVANHQSHIDTAALLMSLPLRYLHHAYPVAAADYFFSGRVRRVLSSVVVNGVPFDREMGAERSLKICRHMLRLSDNILILFPEGTRSTDGRVGRFRSGIGRLVQGTDVPVVPCHLAGAERAYPKGAYLPRPAKLVLRIGEPRTYGELEPSRDTVRHIAGDLQQAVMELAPGAPV
jgi:1-acyl-sn-glycerol-3-phosphate acyltransferase